MSFSGGITPNHVLVNYHEATIWSSTGYQHEGAVLAPFTNSVSLSGGAINGVAYLAGDVLKTGNAEFHNYAFTGTLSPVPEISGGFAWILVGGIGFLRHRKR